MTSDAQKRANARYKKSKTKQLCLRFFKSDEDLWEHLQTKSNKQGYIKGLIRKDIDDGAER
jgi:hypothetical protein